MLADVNHTVGTVGVAQPEIEREIAVRRHQVRVVVHRARVNLIPPSRLNADKGQAKTQAGDHHPAAAEHRILFWRPPTLQHGQPVGLRQRVEHRQVVIQPEALLAWTLINSVEVVADAAEQLLDQRGAAFRQLIRQRITFLAQRAQDIQRRRRRIEPDAIADATIAGRVVGQDQRNAFFAVGYSGQIGPTPRQFSDEIHSFGLRAVAHHVRLAALAAPRQVLEADRSADDPPVQFRQRNVHGQVPRAETLVAGLPTGLVILGANGLDHRNIAAKRPDMRRFGTRLGKAGSVENYRGADFVQPVLDHRQAAGFFQAGHGNRQRVQPRRLQALAENIDEGGIGRLQVRAIKQHGGHGLSGLPVGLPIG